MVMFEMLCGYHPFYSDDRDIIKKNILQGRIEFPEFVSDDAAMVVAKLLVRKVERRLGTKRGAVDIKAQQFFASVDFEKMFRKEIKPPFEPELVKRE